VVILCAIRGSSIDIWNFVCLASAFSIHLAEHRSDVEHFNHYDSQTWKLALGQLLFNGCSSPSAPYSASFHLAQITALYGPVAKSLLQRSKHAAKYYGSNGMCLIIVEQHWSCSFNSGNALSKSTCLPCSFESFVDNPEIQADGQRKEFVNFISSMLRWDLNERLSAESCLNASG
jgi:hypothetical protein